MSDDNPGSLPDKEPGVREPLLGGGTVTFSGPELEAFVERVKRRLGAQTRSEGVPALLLLGLGRAVSGNGTSVMTAAPPAMSVLVTSTISPGAGAGKSMYI